MIQANIWEGKMYPLLNWQEDQPFICLYATQVWWGEWGLIHMRMMLISPGCCLATTLQQSVCSFGIVEGALEAWIHIPTSHYGMPCSFEGKGNLAGLKLFLAIRPWEAEPAVYWENKGSICEMCHLLYFCSSFSHALWPSVPGQGTCNSVWSEGCVRVYKLFSLAWHWTDLLLSSLWRPVLVPDSMKCLVLNV